MPRKQSAYFKRFLLLSGALLLALAVAVGSALWALLQVPDFYETALTDLPGQDVRKQEAKVLVQETLRLVDEIKHADSWSHEFTQQQVNSWLVEDFPRQFADRVPPGVSDPRVRFGDGVVHVGFRYQRDDWNGVVSLRLRPWLAETNRLAVEIESAKAGLVPVPLEDVLGELTRQMNEHGWQIQWQQQGGNDVGIVDLDQRSTLTAQLETIEVAEGVIRVSGRGRTDKNLAKFPRLAFQSSQ